MSFADIKEEVSVSFEFFPPADLGNAERFWESIDNLAQLKHMIGNTLVHNHLKAAGPILTK